MVPPHTPMRLPLKFIGLLILNAALILVIVISLGWHEAFQNRSYTRYQNLAYVILGVAGAMALLEQWIWDKLRGRA